MAIATEINRTDELTTDGSIEDFDFSMLIYDESEVDVFFKATGGSYGQLTLNTDYGVVFTEDGGTVSTNGYTSPLVAGSLVIIRHIPDTMETNWRYLDSHSEQQHQDDFDRLVIRILQLKEHLDRCMKFAIHYAVSGMDMELPAPAANLILGWNGAANGLENKTPDALGLTAALNDLTDTDVGSPTVGDTVQWDGSSWKKVNTASLASFELVKTGNVPGSNGNCHFIISGTKLILEARVGGAWVDTGFFITIA